MSVGILDYGVGNIGSILSMHRKLMIPAARVRTPDDLEAHDRFILPGVGAFDRAMRLFRESDLLHPLRELVMEERRPLLGICLGMQMLADGSDEGGQEPGLGWIAGRAMSMAGMLPLGTRLPFMGWAYIDQRRPSALFPTDNEPQRFYFVHSFAFVPDDPQDVIADVDYGRPVCAVVSRGNVMGTQFHPEKSHRYGMSMLRSYSSAVVTP